MHFGFTDEQDQFRAEVRRFLDREVPMARVRASMEADAPHDEDLWRRMCELGWPALTIPEAYGGLGLAWEDFVVVAEETGRSLCASPLATSAIAARAILRLGSENQKRRWLPAIATGELLVSLAVLEESDDLSVHGIEAEVETSGETFAISGRKMLVRYAQAADLLLVAAREGAGISLFAVPTRAPGVTVTPLRLVDATQRASLVELEAVTLEPSERLGEPGDVWPDLVSVLAAGTVGLSAEMVGAADAAVRMTAEYAKIRKQFGQPIGRFQGVKHRLAELYVLVESARSLVYYASWAVDHLDAPVGPVSMAKASASEALDEAGESAVQLHGAVGFTAECDAQLYYKRGRFCRGILGSPEYHRENLLVAGGL